MYEIPHISYTGEARIKFNQDLYAPTFNTSNKTEITEILSKVDLQSEII
jgi:hypothetical protein